MKEKVKAMMQGKALLPGTLAEHYNVCGKPQCCCKDKVNPRKHGPYYRLSYSLRGKNSSISIKKEDAPLIREMTDNYRGFRLNTQELGLDMIELYRKKGLQTMLDEYEQMINAEVTRKTGTKSASRILRETNSSLTNWKSKALERKSEIKKMQVKIRDLEKSRNNWKSKTMQQKEENQGLIREVEDIKKNCTGSL